VTPQSDFFRLGGQSLTAVRLFAKIKRSYGVELSAATIYEAPTIEKLAKRVRDAQAPGPISASCLIPIRSTGSKSPLFLFPDMNGTTIGFDSLVRCLAPDRPIYGAESQTFTGDRPAALSLEEMAVQFVANIRSVWPHGPYNLLGYSFGGLLGFEVAQQLLASGETVGWLGMLDTWQLGHIRELDAIHSRSQKVARRARKAIVHARRIVFGPDRFAYFEDYVVGRIRRQVMASVFGRLLARYQRDRRPLPKVLRRANEINWFVAQQYVARPYPGRIAMFRAINGIASDDPRYGEALGWQNLAAGGVEVHEVPGTHRALLQEPNVRILAREIVACLTAAETQVKENVTEVTSVNLAV
jgi:thioesterase domain-containing protein